MVMEIQQTGTGNTVLDSNGILLAPGAATSGAPQNSPPYSLQGTAWNSNGAGASEPVEFLTYVLPTEVSGTHPIGNLVFASSVNGATPVTRLQLTSAGQLLAADGSAAAPSVSFGSQAGTGLYYSTGQLNIAVNGVNEISIDSSGNLIFQTGASQVIPGATSFSVRNHANTRDNVLVSDAGVVTLSNASANALTLSGNGAGITFSGNGPNVIAAASSQNLAIMPSYPGRLGIGTTTPSSFVDLTFSGIASTQSDLFALSLVNTTAAYSGQPEFSPPLRWRGNLWNGSNSLPVDFRAYVVPVNSSVSGSFRLESQINSGGYGNPLIFTTAGFLGLSVGVPLSTLHLGGGLTLQAVDKLAAYTMTRMDCIVTAGAGTGAFTVTLPAASTAFGFLVHIKKKDATTTHPVTVAADGSDTIEGAASVTLSLQYNSITLYANGVDTWYKIAST